MNHCPKCGNKLEPGQNYCSNCGQKPAKEKTEKVRTRRPENNGWVMTFVLIILLIIAIAAVVSGVVIMLNSDNNPIPNPQPSPTSTPTPTPTPTPTLIPSPTPTPTPTPTSTPVIYSLTLSVSEGTLIGIPSTTYYPSGTQVTLTATMVTPAPGRIFIAWCGPICPMYVTCPTVCGAPLTITMNSNITADASFDSVCPQGYYWNGSNQTCEESPIEIIGF